jgi:mannitol 2-dehydrogenase
MSISTPRPQTGSLPLCEATLHVHASHVRVPTYDRSTLTPGVVHLGVGAFHRAHQAVYLDDLAERGFSTWGVVGVALRRRAMKEALEPQDGLLPWSRGAHGEMTHVSSDRCCGCSSPQRRRRLSSTRSPTHARGS